MEGICLRYLEQKRGMVFIPSDHVSQEIVVSLLVARHKKAFEEFMTKRDEVGPAIECYGVVQ